MADEDWIAKQLERLSAEMLDNYKLLRMAVDKMQAHIDEHEKDQETTQKEFITSYKLMNQTVDSLQKQMGDPKGLEKEVADLKGRVKQLETQLAKMGKK